MRSEKLEETALWRAYQEKNISGSKRTAWIKEVYEDAVKYLLDVRRTFQNYTLHDETHVLNVLDAMGGLLGNHIADLTVGETELLILAACLHDLGMVYTEEERQRYYKDEEGCRKFLREHCPELLGCSPEEWPEETRQWYLRTLHPFRLAEILQAEAWRELMGRWPLDAVPKRCVLAVCQAHGEEPRELLNDEDLVYLSADETDPLFCALMLRLGDLLDFDDTRAPRVLYHYVRCNETSVKEWKKHQASAGFRYPVKPLGDELPYKACCTNPGIEHAIRDFLDWVDEELGNCMKLKKHCRAQWQQNFPFPRAVSRREIESDGYMSGDFCLTMDQTQILKLLSGENLYDDRSVFVRELLQNAIDATLLRGRMDPGFSPENARIDLWEWNDKEGNIWFRIDDQGTGMTLGMLQRYFLKVGNSYYNSQELVRDLQDHGQTEDFHGISRFGIGFLSCFLCGDYAEVSTLYVDSEKNRREEDSARSSRNVRYGLRLQVTGLDGYYTLKNQAKQHPADRPLPAPDFGSGAEIGGLEGNHYRAKAGTSIVVRLDPGRLGAMDLEEAAAKYLCGSRVPVYYNNRRIGQTYEELMAEAHEYAGERIYELTQEQKAEFDRLFPAVCGQYPRLAVTVIPLDTEENRILQGLSGMLIRQEVRFERTPRWKVKDQSYELQASIEGFREIFLMGHNRDGEIMVPFRWERLEDIYGSENVSALGAVFEKMSCCPQSEEILGEVWLPFQGKISLYTAWVCYCNHKGDKFTDIPFAECKIPAALDLDTDNRHGNIVCVYQGIKSGILGYGSDREYSGILLLENNWRPTVDVSRSEISELPLKIVAAISGLFRKYQMDDGGWRLLDRMKGWKDSLLTEWREVRASQAGRWLEENEKNYFAELMQVLRQPLMTGRDVQHTFTPFTDYDGSGVLNRFFMACVQDDFEMTVDFEAGQTIAFCQKEDVETPDIYELFPPMMFCRAANERSRRYICCDNFVLRRGITADHPFTVWLLENAVQLHRYFGRQFQQIVHCLREEHAGGIISECNAVREQLLSMADYRGVDIKSMPLLSKSDFWSARSEEMD